MRKILVAPSILSADFGRLNDEVYKIESAGADMVHLDIMDGHFVPNLSFGFPVAAAILRYTRLPAMIHLMMYNSGLYAPKFLKLARENDTIIIHTKAEANPIILFNWLRKKGMRLGVAYNPDEENLPYLRELARIIEVVLIMSVYPGFGAQEFIRGSERLVEYASRIRDEIGANYDIAVDGGINNETAKIVKNAGCNILIAGNYIFNGKISCTEAIRKLKEE